MNKLTGEAWVTSREKRAMDIALSTALLPVGGPMALVAAGLIRTVDGVDPIFTQQRPGRNEELFTIYKLRTMPGVEGNVQSVGGFNDSRASSIGRVLRKIRLDEVPQLLNVYKGEMAVVGPRPIVQSEYEEIMDSLGTSEQKAWQRARSVCRPGMIDHFGLRAYVDGYDIPTAERVGADIDYAENATFVGDIKLIGSCLGLFSSMFSSNENGQHNTKTHQYKRGAFILRNAAKSFDVPVTTENYLYWDSMFRATRALDNQLDKHGVTEITSFLDNLFAGKVFGDVDEHLAKQFSEAMQNLPTERRVYVHDSLTQLAEFAQNKKECKNAHELAMVSMAEAVWFASLLELDGTNDESGNTTRFNTWLREIAQTGEGIDAAIDMKKDYVQGSIGFNPTRTDRLKVAIQGVKHARAGLKGTSLRTKRDLASAAWICIRDS